MHMINGTCNGRLEGPRVMTTHNHHIFFLQRILGWRILKNVLIYILQVKVCLITLLVIFRLLFNSMTTNYPFLIRDLLAGQGWVAFEASFITVINRYLPVKINVPINSATSLSCLRIYIIQFQKDQWENNTSFACILTVRKKCGNWTITLDIQQK